MTSPAEHQSDDLDALRAIIAAQASQIQELSRSNRAYEALVDALRVQIVRLKKQKFGASSEKVARNIEQLELALEGLEVARAAIDRSADEDEAVAPPQKTASSRRRGKPALSEHVLTERRTLDPGSECPDCGG
ncbi:MAG TPA: IS66 family transposase, partial [Pelagibacterium sp.]|nr:IS66 family transposase [Pelagibacterium sp.]